MIVVVVAFRKDGRVTCLSDTRDVKVVLDYPDDETVAPVQHEAGWSPTLVANVLEEAEEWE